jgi:hypothetical protein
MKSIFVLLAFFCFDRAAAQQKYIDVTVSDTVLVKLDLFVYKLIMTPNQDVPEYVATRKGRQAIENFYQQLQSTATDRFGSLKAALKAAGFAV